MFDEEALVHELSALPARHRVAFAASCCERLLPNYRAFWLMENWGDPALLRQALDEVWRFLDGASLSKERIHELVQICRTIIPDSEDFTSLFVGAAQEAVVAIIHVLKCCRGDAREAALAGRAAMETVDSYLYMVNSPYLDTGEQVTLIDESLALSGPVLTEVEKVNRRNEELDKQRWAFYEWLEQTPLMVAELEKQRRDLETLKSSPVLTPALLEYLRQTSARSGIRPIARGIVKDKPA